MPACSIRQLPTQPSVNFQSPVSNRAPSRACSLNILFSLARRSAGDNRIARGESRYETVDVILAVYPAIFGNIGARYIKAGCRKLTIRKVWLTAARSAPYSLTV